MSIIKLVLVTGFEPAQAILGNAVLTVTPNEHKVSFENSIYL